MSARGGNTRDGGTALWFFGKEKDLSSLKKHELFLNDSTWVALMMYSLFRIDTEKGSFIRQSNVVVP